MLNLKCGSLAEIAVRKHLWGSRTMRCEVVHRSVTDQQELRTLLCVRCGLERMRYSRGKVPQISGILETVHDSKSRQEHLSTYYHGHIITPICVDRCYFRGSLPNVVLGLFKREDVLTLMT
jgi:hypothetical protein